jgi:hypothetical protein
MQYHLSFFDDNERLTDICRAEITNKETALLWMRIVGAVWARQYAWSRVELCCQGRCIARLLDATLAQPTAKTQSETSGRSAIPSLAWGSE